MAEQCGVCGFDEYLINGVECPRCDARAEDGGWSYDPEHVDEVIRDERRREDEDGDR